MITRYTGIFIGLFSMLGAFAQGGDAQVRTKADALFNEERFAEAMPLYSQLISLEPADHQLNYHYGTCVLFGGNNKEKAVGYLKFAVTDPSITPQAWYWLGRAYHLNYRFDLALEAYGTFKTTADKKALAAKPVQALERQCQNGQKLLSNLKEIDVRNKVEVDENEFFRFYDLREIGGRIVVLPEELKTNYDKKQKERSLIYLPDGDGPIYFSSYGKDGKTGKDIYRTELLPTGSFATPIKIPGYINTDQDEDFPFLHPDGSSFYFSSKGHNSMGGYDVFRAVYDRRADTFGRPENLDFAVNTPDDDFLYIVDPEHKEACFASGRTSSQGKLHVYRVSTSQVPLVITVLQGGYSSEINAGDKSARIVVEDALTRERITEVRSGKDGSYVLALPRPGRFRFLVECGPSGKTHLGIVDVPRSDGPRAYKQELVLTQSADQEKLMIRNFFDQPLDGDLIALALDEIKRRADLNVNERPAEPVIAQEHFDVLTRAGFSGQYDEATVQRMADEDASELTIKSDDAGVQAEKAYALAVDAVKDAEDLSRDAERIASEAMLLKNEEERFARMALAAELRDDSQVAATQAQIAYRTAQDLEAEQRSLAERAANATRLAADIRTALANEQPDLAVQHLTVLKERLDQKARPDQDPDALMRAEQEVLEKDKATRLAMRKVNNASADENDLAERISRLEREKQNIKNNKRIEEIDRESARYKEDLVQLKKEKEASVAALKQQENELLVLRGDLALKKHLSNSRDTMALKVDRREIDELAGRLATTNDRLEKLYVDERFVAHSPASAEQRGERVFDWGSTGSASATERAAARTVARNDPGDVARDGTRSAALPDDSADNSPGSSDLAVAEDGAVPGTAEPAGSPEVPGEGRPSAEESRTTQNTTTGQDQPEVGTADRNSSETTGSATTEERVAGSTDNATPSSGNSEDPSDITKLTPEQVRSGSAGRVEVPGTTGVQAIDAATERFFLENELAELMQLQQAEKNASRRDSIQRRRVEVTAELERADAIAAKAIKELEDAAGEDIWEPVDLERVPMVFNRDTKEEELIGELFSEYYTHQGNLTRLTDADIRAEGLHGLELMLSDSLRAEMARQLMVLELDPQQAERILPRVDRLRQIRESHLRQGEQHLQDRQDEVAALGDPVGIEEPWSEAPVAVRYDRKSSELPPADAITDKFVHLHEDPLMVYYSEIQHRSPDVAEGLERKGSDLARMDLLSQQIDSALQELAVTKRGKDFDKLRKSTDRLEDDRLIIRTELGQRSAYLTKEEWRTASDSVRVLQRGITTLGLPDSEPVALMARDMRTEALKTFDEGAQVRKSADRTSDIIVRDSLYRRAYHLELEALREMDRAITVQNYLLSDSHVRGESLTYQALATKVLGLDGQLADATQEQGPRVARPVTTPEGSSDLATEAPTSDATRPDTSEQGREEQRSGTDASTGTISDQEVDSVAAASSPTPSGQEASRVPAESSPSPAADSIIEEPGVAARIAGAREKALQMVRSNEEKLPEEARKAPHTYERLLAQETAPIDPRKIQPVEDPEMLRKLITTTLEGSVALDRKAMEHSDRAVALEDSAATVAKRKQYTVYRMAARQRELSDSLRTASLLKAQDSKQMEAQEREALHNEKFYRRLVKYYYLDPEELALVMQVEDNSSYFQAQARALEQLAAADVAASAANSNRDLGEAMEQQASTIEEQARNGRMNAVEANEQARVLNDKAGLLIARADSLGSVATRLREAAAQNEERANVILNGLGTADGSELRDLELRSRRKEDMVSELRPRRVEPGAPVTDAHTVGGEVASGATLIDERTEASDPDGEELVSGAPTTGSDRDPSQNEQDPSATLPAAEGQGTTRAEGDEQDRVALEGGITGSTTDVPAAAGTPALPVAETLPAPMLLGDRPFTIPKQLERDIFEIKAEGERRAQPILMNEEMPVGIIYKVQIGAFRNQIPSETFSDMTPVMGEDAGNGLTRYTAGLFLSFDQAFSAKDKVRDRGYRDAFVVAYRNGERIPLGEAMRASRDGDVIAQEQQGPIRSIQTAEQPQAQVPAQRQQQGTVPGQQEPQTAEQQAQPQQPRSPGRDPNRPIQLPIEQRGRIDPGQPVTDRSAQDGVGSVAIQPVTDTQNPGEQPVVERQQPRTTPEQPSGSGQQPQQTTGNVPGPEPAAGQPQTAGSMEQGVPAIPVQTVPLDPEEEKRIILEKYPADPEAIIAQFKPVPSTANYYPVTGAAPARPVEMIMGLFYTVQVGVYTKPVALDKLYNITPLVSELTETEKIRYSTGVYTDMEVARARRLAIVDMGVKDAFVTAYLNGKRIPIRDANALLEQHGTGILAKP